MKSTGRRKKKAAEKPDLGKVKKVGPQNAEEVFGRCRNLALGDLEEVTHGVLALAKKGSCQHAKFIFELAEQGKASESEEQGEDSLAALLLRELEKPAAAEQDGTA